MFSRILTLVVLLPLSMRFAAAQPQSKLASHLRELQLSAEQALSRGDPASAVEIVQKGLKLKPDWKEGLWTLGWTQFQTKQFEAARETFVKLVRLAPKKGASWLLLGLCEFQARDYGMALDDLLRGRALGIPASLEIASQVRYSTVVALLVAARFDRALRLLEESAREHEHTDEILLVWGLAAMRMPVDPKQIDEVIPEAQLVMLKSVGEAMFHAASHEYDDMKKIYNDLFQRYPSAPKLHHSYGFLLIRLGDIGAAETQFREELKVDPKSVLGRLGLAFVALERADADESIRFSQEAVGLNPQSASAQLLLGRALLLGNRPEDAVSALEAARDLEPANHQTHFLLARAYGKIHRETDAANERSEFLRLKKMDEQLKFPMHGNSDSPAESSTLQEAVGKQ